MNERVPTADPSPADKRRRLAELLREKDAGTDTGYPLSFPQERLWFLDQFHPGGNAFNIPTPVPLTGPVNVGALKRAINEIVRRHQVLRTHFAAVDGLPRQIVKPSLELELPVVDLQRLPQHERAAKAAELADEHAQQPFDLATGPLLRTTLLKLAHDDHLLLLTMHHIVSDGWSMGIFFHELGALYHAYHTGQRSPLPELSVQYVHFAAWQRQQLQGGLMSSLVSYWKRRLDGAAYFLELPTDRPRPAKQSFRGAVEPITLPAELSNALKALSAQQKATLFMTLLTGFVILLYRWTHLTDIIVGTPIANRNRAEFEGLIGFFVNSLVLRVDLSGDPTFSELLRQVKEITLQAYAHQDLPFERLVEELQPERSLSHTPLFQVVFTLQNAPTGQPAKAGGRAGAPPPKSLSTTIFPQTHTAKFDLNLSMAETPDGMGGAFEYNTDIFDRFTIRRLGGYLENLLAGATANPDQPLSRLRILSDAETGGRTTSDYPDAELSDMEFENMIMSLKG